jgi:hypothetical protein
MTQITLIVTGKLETAMMASLYSGTWHFSSLEGIGKSSSYVLLAGYGKNSRTKKAGPAYTIFVVSLDLSLSLSLSLCAVTFMHYVGNNNIR